MINRVKKGFLIDTNHLSPLFRRDETVLGNLSRNPGCPIFASVISLGEVEAGHAITNSTNLDVRTQFESFIQNEFYPNALPIKRTTRIYYSMVMEKIWSEFPPSSKTQTESHLRSIGVDINDVWIVSQAIEHNLILATTDSMKSIKKSVGNLVDFENWTN